MHVWSINLQQKSQKDTWGNDSLFNKLILGKLDHYVTHTHTHTHTHRGILLRHKKE